MSASCVLSLTEAKAHLRTILEAYASPDGIPVDLLCAYYKKHSGVLLNEETVKQFGCERVADFLRKLDDLVELRRSDEFRYIVYLRNAFDIKPLKPQRNHDLRAQASTESEGATSMVDESVRRRVFNLFSKQRRVIKLDDFMDTYEERYADRPDVVRYGCLQLQQFIQSMSDLFEVAPSQENRDLLEIRVRDDLPAGYTVADANRKAVREHRARDTQAKEHGTQSGDRRRGFDSQMDVKSGIVTVATNVGTLLKTVHGKLAQENSAEEATAAQSGAGDDLELYMQDFRQPRELSPTDLDALMVQAVLAACRGTLPAGGLTPDELAKCFHEHVGVSLEVFGLSAATIASSHKHLFSTTYSLDADRASLLRLRPHVELRARKQSIPVMPESPACGMVDVMCDAVTSQTVQYRTHRLQLPEGRNVCLAEVTYVNSPSNFWFMEVGEHASVANRSLVNEINDYYNSLPVCSAYVMPDAYVRRGQVCVALYRDEFTGRSDWFRAWIRAPLSRTRKRPVSVYYVDYGEVGWVMRDDVRFIAMPFMRLPAQAIHARLHGVVPASGALWPKEARDLMVSLVHDRTLVARVHRLGPFGHLIVELCDTSQKATGGNDKCVFIARQIIQSGFAKSGDESTVPIVNEVLRAAHANPTEPSVAAAQCESTASQICNRPQYNCVQQHSSATIADSDFAPCKTASLSKSKHSSTEPRDATCNECNYFPKSTNSIAERSVQRTLRSTNEVDMRTQSRSASLYSVAQNWKKPDSPSRNSSLHAQASSSRPLAEHPSFKDSNFPTVAGDGNVDVNANLPPRKVLRPPKRETIDAFSSAFSCKQPHEHV